MTDWDTCRPGDPRRPGPLAGPVCGALSKPLGIAGHFFVCSRDRHDAGQHVAEGHLLVLAVWPADDVDAVQVAGIPTTFLEGTP